MESNDCKKVMKIGVGAQLLTPIFYQGQHKASWDQNQNLLGSFYHGL